MKKLARGILIALEGGEGSGKSTLAKALAAKLTNTGYTVLRTKEPGGTEVGKEIREIVQHTTSELDPVTEALLYAADRRQHITTLVKPALEAGTIVISDRMADSTRAYQAYGRGIDKNIIEQLVDIAMAGIKPDIVFYLKIDVADAFKRVHNRNEKLSRFEKMDMTFHERLASAYNEIFNGRDDVIHVDASRAPEEIVNETYEAIINFLKIKKY